jgi:hypothetical protein
MKETIPNSLENYQNCHEFLRHKTTLLSPSILAKNNIPYTTVTQEAGQVHLLDQQALLTLADRDYFSVLVSLWIQPWF